MTCTAARTRIHVEVAVTSGVAKACHANWIRCGKLHLQRVVFSYQTRPQLIFKMRVRTGEPLSTADKSE